MLSVRKLAESVLKVVLSLFILNVVIVSVGSFYLQKAFWLFSGKSTPHILSDILFFEGAIILAVGTFLMGSVIFWNGLPLRGPKRVEINKSERQREIYSGIRMTFVGAILIALSVAISTLFL